MDKKSAHLRRVRKWKRILMMIRVDLLVFAVLLAVALLGFRVLRTALLKDAYNLGTSMARTYALEEQSTLTVYETLVNVGADAIATRLEEKRSPQDITDWMAAYNARINSILGDDRVILYAVWDDLILLPAGPEPVGDYDYPSAEWYRSAMAADHGGAVFTNAYTDGLTGETCFTVAQRCGYSDAAVAIDIFPGNMHSDSIADGLPDNSFLFLCDGNGTLIYHQTTLPHDTEDLQGYMDDLLTLINLDELGGYQDSIVNPEGDERGVYYYNMDNGWISIATISREAILRDVNVLMRVFFLLFAGLAGSFLLIAVREWKVQERTLRVRETNQVLGNSYYAIYRVDLQCGAYEIIKSPGFRGSRLPLRGDFSVLMDACMDVIQDETRADFRKSFSIENVQNLIRHHIRDYGGDFQRWFEGDGYRWVNVRVLYDETVSTSEVVLCFRLVDEEKQAQLRERKLLEDSLKASQKSEQTKQAFFRNMSHDMRTPLNAIIGLTDLAIESGDPDQIHGYLEKIRSSGRLLLELINDILEMSRLEQGRVELASKEMDLAQCLEDCLAPFRIQAGQERKELRVDLRLDDTMVLGDAFRITQVMNNLLSNALKFTEPGDTITVEATQVDHKDMASYKLVVADTGIGLSPEFLPKLFDPYTRETRFGVKRVAGTGLGMSIVKSLVTQMSGTIYVDSEPDVGTTFTIILPFTVVDSEARQTQRRAREEHLAAGAVSLAGRHVLLAEDNDINMEIASALLSAAGITVTQAWNGREAVDAYLAQPPFTFDAILMDMQMPELGGCEAARLIRRTGRPDAARIPIVAVTANAFPEDIAATSEAGMDAHLSKPIDNKLLLRLLEQLIRRAENKPNET